jgi:hypothetical protein
MARENPSWGYTRLRGALENLGFDLGRSTIQRILTERGIEPAPLRGRTMRWETFLKAHWGAHRRRGLLQRGGAHAGGPRKSEKIERLGPRATVAFAVLEGMGVPYRPRRWLPRWRRPFARTRGFAP